MLCELIGGLIMPKLSLAGLAAVLIGVEQIKISRYCLLCQAFITSKIAFNRQCRIAQLRRALAKDASEISVHLSKRHG